MIDVALLGTGGMMPLPGRYLTSLLCRQNGKMMLIDCGEGTQVSLKILGWGFKNIDVICFTHFHADHISGLPGLLLTIGNANREEPIHLIGPEGLTEIVKNLCSIAPELPFQIICTELSHKKGEVVPIITENFNLNAFPVSHRITCFAYQIMVNRIGKFNVEAAKKLNIPITFWGRLQKGETVIYDGTEYLPSMVLGEDRLPIKVTYCTDSRPTQGLAGFAKDSDLFICEGIYGEDEKKEKAIHHSHMIFSEAAQLAKEAAASELWLTHFSPSMVNPSEFLNVATKIFSNTIIGKDRMTKTILFKEE